MAGATIDHMISLTILIAALLLAMMSFNQMFSSAVAYETNTQVATKAIDIMNTICLSPGNPTDWGSTNQTVLGFGLQDSLVGGYSLSPYSVMRLNTATDESQLVYFEETGLYYNNISTSYGHSILTPIGACLNYSTVAELMGLDGSYGFSLSVMPTLDIEIEEVSDSPLTLNVNVKGSGLPLSGATLNYHLFHVALGETVGDDTFPAVTAYSDVTETDSSGSVNIPFDIYSEGHGIAYSFTVYVSIGGVTGVGYHTSNTISDGNQYIVPLISSFDEDNDYVNLYLTHSYTILNITNNAAAQYNASFFTLTSDFQLQEYLLENSTALLNTGSKIYNTTRIPRSETGVLVISYFANGRLGSVIVPWGIGALGVEASFGASMGSGNSDFVATEMRQVTIDGISYRVQVSTWKLGN